MDKPAATARLATAVSAVCPIISVAVGRSGDSSTVRIDYAPEATEDQRAAANAALAAFAWEPAPSWPTPEFWARFTIQERAAIVTSADSILALLRYTFSLHPTVEADNQELLAGLDYLVSVGVLTADRKTALLTP